MTTVTDAVDLCGVELAGPILNGSAAPSTRSPPASAFGDELLEQFPFDCFVSKTITVAPRQGNPPPRLYETPAGMINSIGLPNKGVDGFLASDLPQLAELPVPLCVSVMGFSHDELAQLVEAVAPRDEVALIELNVSCPNVETGTIMGADPSETARVVERLRPLTEKPLIVKLTPNATDPPAVADRRPGGRRRRRLADQHAARDGAPPERLRAPVAGRRDGRSQRSSCPTNRPRAGRERVRRACRCRSIGMGGIESGRDAADFLSAGAACVAVGTASFRDPRRRPPDRR